MSNNPTSATYGELLLEEIERTGKPVGKSELRRVLSKDDFTDYEAQLEDLKDKPQVELSRNAELWWQKAKAVLDKTNFIERYPKATKRKVLDEADYLLHEFTFLSDQDRMWFRVPELMDPYYSAIQLLECDLPVLRSAGELMRPQTKQEIQRQCLEAVIERLGGNVREFVPVMPDGTPMPKGKVTKGLPSLRERMKKHRSWE